MKVLKLYLGIVLGKQPKHENTKKNKHMKNFTAVRKPIYVAEVTASGSDFPFTTDLFKKFVEKNPEYADCQYDSKYSNGTWTLKLYRECAIDFV